MKAYWGSGGTAPLILASALDGGEWSASSPWYPLGRRLNGLQSRSGRGGEEKNS